jgi:hypothetical protein
MNFDFKCARIIYIICPTNLLANFPERYSDNEHQITLATGAGIFSVYNNCKDAEGRATYESVAEAYKPSSSKQ